jgi:hypothetical protein
MIVRAEVTKTKGYRLPPGALQTNTQKLESTGP